MSDSAISQEVSFIYIIYIMGKIKKTKQDPVKISLLVIDQIGMRHFPAQNASSLILSLSLSTTQLQCWHLRIVGVLSMVTVLTICLSKTELIRGEFYVDMI